ncbi:CvpA family protein [Variovorax dokdonensis]|uniref:CvpA family protein n=1 Tax=Variovorax dokdonensis TaxID=344883 RepID=A0ABT7N7G0_9BURK|nr:CvpA family protein [Variovorax dokdonensis]
MSALDWIAVALLGLSVLVGVWRGLLFEVISLCGWIAAFFVAQWFASDLAEILPMGTPDAPWRYAAAFVLIFVAVAFGIGLLASLIRALVKAVGLRPVDRTLGAVFGLARGVLALLMVAVAVHLFSLEQSAWWRESSSATLLDAALLNAKPALPEKLASYLP